ncbi:MAG: sensor histidine kinase [Myxococcales bacterium]|nr:sensor histidine kinase [Myxococcales bacterium]
MRLSSVSAKIFIAFLVVMATFGGVTAYGAHAMQRLGDELRRISQGYLTLRLDLHDLQTRQFNLLQFLERADDESQRSPSFVKGAVDLARADRKKNIRKLGELVARLQAETTRRDETAFLRGVGERLQAIATVFDEDEALFDRVYGAPFAKPLAPGDPGSAAVRDQLLHREERLWKRDLGDLTRDLRARVQEAEDQLLRDERRAVWATVLLALIAALIGLLVIVVTQRALAPLRRLAAGAQQLARGDYQQRVQVHSGDEIGTLAREFNAMAAALEEREQRLIRSERLAAVGKIAAQITHEVRNPLSSIGLNAELLEEELAGLDASAEARDLVRAIIQEVDRLGEITEEYLRFARLPRPKLEREDVNAIVSSLLVFMREELATRGITVEAHLGEDLPTIPADENQLRQALLNLLRNAAEAMRDGGRLTVVTSAAGAQVRVAIGDTGEGIAPEHRGKIFDPFFSTKEGGTGLGLALTQQIVVEHGGVLEVDSEAGRGTTFTVRLPMLPLADASPSPTARP